MNLVIKNLSVRLGGFDLSLNESLRKPLTGIFGPSGSGKTTLLELIAGLRRPALGSVSLGEITLADAASHTFVPARKRGIGYVPQDLALFPHLTARNNIRYGAKTANTPLFDRLCKVLELDRHLDKYPLSLSGGEKQRVALARALFASPRLLLLDEPLASLDQALKERIIPCFKRVHEEFGTPIVYVSHAIPEIIALCDDVLVLEMGKATAHGSPEQVFVSSESLSYRTRER